MDTLSLVNEQSLQGSYLYSENIIEKLIDILKVVYIEENCFFHKSLRNSSRLRSAGNRIHMRRVRL